MAIKTLYEYYKSKGNNLPGIAERGKEYERIGFGPASSYKGSYPQNVALLESLKGRIEQKPESSQSSVNPVDRLQNQANAPRLPVQTTIAKKQVPTNVGLFQQYQKTTDDRLKALELKRENFLKEQELLPKQYDIYKQTRTERGIDPLRKRAESLDERLAGMENAIFTSEQDIRDRITKSGGIVTESQVQRLAASETRPLIESYRRLLSERNRLGQTITNEEAAAKELAGLKYEDAARPLKIAKQRLAFTKQDFNLYSGIAKELFGASQKDVNRIIKMSESEDKAERDRAKQAIDFAFKMANLSVKTPEGVSFKIGDQTVRGVKKPRSDSPVSPTAFNIRSGLAGLTKEQANDIITEETPQEWFKIKEEAKSRMSLTAEALQKRWSSLKAKVQKEAEKSAENPFEKIVQEALKQK